MGENSNSGTFVQLSIPIFDGLHKHCKKWMEKYLWINK